MRMIKCASGPVTAVQNRPIRSQQPIAIPPFKIETCLHSRSSLVFSTYLRLACPGILVFR